MEQLFREPVHKPFVKGFFAWLSIVCRGFAMGLADVIPGVSGGTIAFITGIYPQLINSLRTLDRQALQLLMRFRVGGFFRHVAWEFLLTLLFGISAAFVLMTHLIRYLLNHEIYHTYLYALFAGLILASAFFCARQVKKWGVKQSVILSIGVLSAYLFTGMTSHKAEEPFFDVQLPKTVAIDEISRAKAQNYDSVNHCLINVSRTTLGALVSKKIIPLDTEIYHQSQQQWGRAGEWASTPVSQRLDPWLIFSGALASSAMLLPGISGAYVLNILGVYTSAITAVAAFTSDLQHGEWNSDAFMLLLNIGIGIIIGLVLCSRMIAWLFKRYYEASIAFLTGFMVGALRAIWPFWSYDFQLDPLKLEEGVQLRLIEPIIPELFSSQAIIALSILCIGFIGVMTLEWAAKKLTTSAAK